MSVRGIYRANVPTIKSCCLSYGICISTVDICCTVILTTVMFCLHEIKEKGIVFSACSNIYMSSISAHVASCRFISLLWLARLYCAIFASFQNFVETHECLTIVVSVFYSLKSDA